MRWLDIIVLIAFLKISEALNNCNQTVTKLQLCTIDEAYDKGTTGWKQLGHPITLNTSITVFNIAEFNEDNNMITLNVLLSVAWNDYRITLKSKDENE